MNLPTSASTAQPQPALTERYSAAMMNTFGPPQRILARGDGCEVFDTDGRRYLDLLAGIAVNSLGHAHPTLTAAVTAQMSTLGHISNFFSSTPQVGLAERLLEISRMPQGSKVFFANSGTEAIEAAIKIARRTGRSGIVAAGGAFHGRTTGALALTHKPAYREPFEPLLPGVSHVPYGDVEALRAAVTDQTSAVVLEPILGEGGVIPAPPGYLTAAREITSAAGALLIIDEIQTGIGRTGEWFGLHHEPGLEPDVITLAKGLGGGFPIGAVVAGPRAADHLGPGSHGSTFGGNPPACAAGLAVLHVIERDGLLENTSRVGHQLRTTLQAAHPAITEIRGEGLLIGVQLNADIAPAVVRAALDAGFLVNAVQPSVLRLAPPLILAPAQAAEFTDALPGLIDTAQETAG